MEMKKSVLRGIQQEDVWRAADSLIKDGLRPTIERVRQKIGRGSPNTVSPMLEAWFSTLGARLGVKDETNNPSAIPQALQQAMQDFWDLALSKGREAFAVEAIQAKAELELAVLALSQREADLHQLEFVREAKKEALEKALWVANNSIAEARQQTALLKEIVGKREAELQGIQVRLASVEAAREKERIACQDSALAHTQECQRVEERNRFAQCHLLEEIDRARLETKKLFNAYQTAEKNYAAEKSLFHKKIRSHEESLSEARALQAASSLELATVQQSASVLEATASKLHDLLKLQLADSQSSVAHLTEILRSGTRRNSANRTTEQRGLLIRKSNRTFLKQKGPGSK